MYIIDACDNYIIYFTSFSDYGEEIAEIKNAILETNMVIAKLELVQREQSVKIDKVLDLLLAQKNQHLLDSNDSMHTSSFGDYNKGIKICSFEFPLHTVEGVKELDKALSDGKFKRELKSRIFKTIGKNDGDVGGQYLNKMGHQLFTDQLLLMFTFKGISRGGQKKESFSSLRNILLLFQNMLAEVNPAFDMRRTEKYIQTKLLRHCGSRIKRL